MDPVWIEDGGGHRLDVDRGYLTAPYQARQFEHGTVLIERSSYQDQAVDDDGDGTGDRLQVAFQVTANRSETVRVWATLEDSRGNKVARAEGLAVLDGSPATPQSTTVRLDFDGRQINAHGVDGPFQLVSVTLVSVQGAVLDVHPLAYRTALYLAAQFASWAERLYLPIITAR